MASYQFTVATKRKLTLKQVEATEKALLRSLGTTAGIVGRHLPKSPETRSERIGEIMSRLSDCASDTEDLKSEFENWRDSIPENLQGGDKYSSLDECVSNLEDAASYIQSSEDSLGAVDVPSMFG